MHAKSKFTVLSLCIPFIFVGLLATEISFAATAPVITAVYTTYSATGVPTDLSITGTGLCSTTTCTTKPVVKLAGVQQTVTGGTNTGVGVKLGVIADGDYVLTLTVGTVSASYNLTIRSGGTGGTGTSATVTVGTTTTGAAGSNAAVTNSGTSSAAVLNFTIPRGATGATGATGPAGPQGPIGVPGPQGIPGLPGSTGATGATGPVGPVGPVGPKGDKGDAGTAGAGLVYKGMWADATAYSPQDVVTYGGSSYIALLNSTAVNPAIDVTSAAGNWALLSAKGADGAAGADGAPGLAGPPGIPGPTGPKGDAGEPGLAGARGPKGDDGNIGPMGPPGPRGLGLEPWSATVVYPPGAMVYTETEPSGMAAFCVYYALAETTGEDPRTHSAAVTNANWAALDQSCRTGITVPPIGNGYTLAGSLSGLGSSTGVVLSLTADGISTTAPITANGPFTLPRKVSFGASYTVAIASQPLGVACGIANGSGTVGGDVSNLAVSCAALSSDLQSLKITYSFATLAIAYPRQFAATGIAENGNRTDLTLAATWSSSDTSIVTVNATGQVTGVAVGKATISASYGGFSTSTEVSVLDGPLVTTLAGSLTAGTTDGIGEFAAFDNINGITVDQNDNVYVTERWANVIRKIDSRTREVTTIAGRSWSAGSQDGIGPNARFGELRGITADKSGNLYVADSGNSKIRKITFDGANAIVSTLSGSGTTGYANSAESDNDGATAMFSGPTGIAVDDDGTVYVTDAENHCIRKISPSGKTSTLAGTNQSGNEDGIGQTARFAQPFAMTRDTDGYLYVGDWGNWWQLRKITRDGVATTLPANVGYMTARNQKIYYSHENALVSLDTVTYIASMIKNGGGYKNGPLSEAQIDFGWMAFDSKGNLYVTTGTSIRKITQIP